LLLLVFRPPTTKSVIATEAVHSLTVNRAVERPPYFVFTPPRNKSQKVGVFFSAEKVSVKTPQSPHNPPQIDHQNTTFSHLFLPKPPAKTTNHHSN
jgi:hypothetical protein